MRLAHLSPGRAVVFLGWDGRQYPAQVLSLPRCGLVRVAYTVRGLGVVRPAVDCKRLRKP